MKRTPIGAGDPRASIGLARTEVSSVPRDPPRHVPPPGGSPPLFHVKHRRPGRDQWERPPTALSEMVAGGVERPAGWSVPKAGDPERGVSPVSRRSIGEAAACRRPPSGPFLSGDRSRAGVEETLSGAGQVRSRENAGLLFEGGRGRDGVSVAQTPPLRRWSSTGESSPACFRGRANPAPFRRLGFQKGKIRRFRCHPASAKPREPGVGSHSRRFDPSSSPMIF